MTQAPDNWALGVPPSMLRRGLAVVPPPPPMLRKPAAKPSKKPSKKPAKKSPAVRDYLTSAANTALGFTPSSIGQQGFKTGQSIGKYARSTTPGEFGETALAVGKALPQAIYEEAVGGGLSGFGKFLLSMAPGYETFNAVREGARLRSEGSPEEAFAVERGAGPMEVLNLAPLGVIGAGAVKGARAIKQGGERVLGRSAPEVAFATSERVPYVNAGHLPGLFEGEGARTAYSLDPRASWTDEAGQDILYKALSMPQEATRPATGYYKPPGRPGVIETNEATVGLPRVTLTEGRVSDAERRALDAAEAARAYFDVQGAGAWHSVDPKTPGGALFIPRPGRSSAARLDELASLMGERGLGDVVDTGKGVTLTDFYSGPPSREATYEMLESGYGPKLEQLTGRYPEQVSIDSGYRSMFEGVDPSDELPDYVPGSGRITQRLEDMLAEYPEAVDLLDASPEVRARIATGRALDEAMAAELGGANPYVQRAREIASERGLRGLFEARRAGVALPSLAALLSAYGLSGQDDGSGY